MIWHPKVGQRVRIHYGQAALRCKAKYHDCRGIVTRVAGGKGPLNVEVLLLDRGRRQTCVCVPRGNLVATGDRA